MRQIFRTRTARWTTFLGGIGGALALAVLLSSGVSGASSVTPGTVAPASNVAGGSTSYTVTFETSSVTGGIPAALQSCPTQCTITLTAPNNTNFVTTGIYSVHAASGVATVGSVAVSKVTGPGASSTSSTDNQVIITLSSSTIGASDTVTVTVPNVSNPTTASSSNVIDESTSSDTTPTATAAYSIVAGPADHLVVVSGSGQHANTGSTFASPLQVALQDHYNNPVTTPGINVTFTAPASGASATFTTNTNTDTVPTNSNGVATSSAVTANATPATGYQVQVTGLTNTGVIDGAAFTLINVGAPAKVVFPNPAVSGSASSSANIQISIQEQDAVGNPTTGAETVNLTSSAGTGFFSATSGGTPVTSVNIASGSSSVSFFYGDTKAGMPQITAAASGLNSGMQTETVNPASASKLVFTNMPATGAASSSATLGPITVQERDAFDNPTTTAETVNLTSTAGTGVFSATSGGATVTSVNITSGSSNASFFYGDTKTGTPQITAAASGLASGMQSETINAASASKLVFTNAPVPGSASPSANIPITVQEQDAFNNPTTTAETVNLSSNTAGTAVFSATSGGATVTSVNITTGSSSKSFFYGDTKAGSPQVTAAAGGLTSAMQTETVNAANPAKIGVVSGSGQSTPAGQTFALPLTAQVEDAFGNPVTGSGVLITFTAPNTGASATFNNTTNVETDATGANGEAVTSTLTANATAGVPYSVQATNGSYTGTSFTLTNVGAPSQLVFTSSPVSGAASSSATLGPITVQEQDAFGNPTTSAETVNLSSNSAGTAVFSATSGGSATTSVNITSGSSSASFFYGDTKAGSPQITAAASGLTSAMQTETVSAGLPGHLVFTTEPGGADAGSALSPQPVVAIYDAFGNPITTGSGSTDTITVTLPAGSFTAAQARTAHAGSFANGQPSASVAAVGGVATFSGLAVDQPGDYTLSASDTTTPAVPHVTSSQFTVTQPVVPPTPHGYWLEGSDGGIFSFGSAEFHGSMGGISLQRPVVGIVPTADGGGYWLVASDGGVFSFGDTQFYGSIPGLGLHPAGSGLPNSLNAPIVAMVPSIDDGGYFMVASDGGVFAFGDATFAGSCPGIGGCSGSAVAVVPDGTGNGYWLITSNGNVYPFGDAPYLGAPGRQAAPITAAVATPSGDGYLILDGVGKVFSYGDAPALGSAPSGSLGVLNPTTAIFATSTGQGYWVVDALGQVFPFGDAPNDGDLSGTHLNAPIIAASGS